MAGFHFPAKAKAALAQIPGFSSHAEQRALFLQEKEKLICLQDVRAAWDGAVRSPKGRMSQREALTRLSQRRGGDGRAERARSACQGVRS